MNQADATDMPTPDARLFSEDFGRFQSLPRFPVMIFARRGQKHSRANLVCDCGRIPSDRLCILPELVALKRRCRK
jgi:hypothetical protein